MDNEDFENELNVPSLEKLESMSQLFEHAMSGIEQELFLRYMFMRGIELMGAENAGTMFLQAQQDLLRMSTPTAEQQHDDDEGWVEVIEEVQ
jgi:hypothetical protein